MTHNLWRKLKSNPGEAPCTRSASLPASCRLFCLRQEPLPCSPDKGIAKTDARRLHSIPIDGNRFLALTCHHSSITIHLDLHVLRLPKCSGASLLNVAEE